MARHSACPKPARPANTTPDVASPRLSRPADPRLPARTRIEIMAALVLSGWGLGLVAIAILRSL